MKSGKTKSGFAFTFDERNIDDMRWVEKCAKLESNPMLISEVVTQMLGEEQKERLYKHLENEDGKVPVERFNQEFEEIMTLAGETDDDVKNS